MNAMRIFGWWRNDRSGSVGLEFAVLALPFLFLILSATELGLLLFAKEVLESRVEEAGRAVYTGQIDGSDTSAIVIGLKERICEASGLALVTADECSANLRLDVRRVSSGGVLPEPVDGSGELIVSAFEVQPVSVGDVVVVRAGIEFPSLMMIPLVDSPTSGSARRVLVAATAFRVQEVLRR